MMDTKFPTTNIILILFIFGYSCDGLQHTKTKCNLPPQYWCSSREIAENCEVTDACRKNVWNLNFKEAPPFSLELYYETLCPFCKIFIREQVYPVYKMAGPSLFNLSLIPFGNAKETWNGTMYQYSCQHGHKECVGNLYETCGLELIANKTEQLEFIYCMEGVKSEDFHEFASKCAGHVGLSSSLLKTCFESTVGNRLQHKMAVRTNSLSPPHKYVPWIVVDGIHNDKIQDDATSNLLRLFCDTYQGVKPAFCIPGDRVCVR